MQWHPTILSKLAIVPQRLINAYSNNKVGAQYEDNDIVVRFPGCANPGELQCEEESKRFLPKWQQAFKNA